MRYFTVKNRNLNYMKRYALHVAAVLLLQL